MRRRGFIFLCFAVLALTALAMFVYSLLPVPPSAPCTLPDGNTLTLTGAKVGARVNFLHGTFRDELLDRVLPAKGLRLGTYYLAKPNKAVALNAIGDRRLFLEFQLVGSSQTMSGGLVTFRPVAVSAVQAGQAPASTTQIPRLIDVLGSSATGGLANPGPVVVYRSTTPVPANQAGQGFVYASGPPADAGYGDSSAATPNPILTSNVVSTLRVGTGGIGGGFGGGPVGPVIVSAPGTAGMFTWTLGAVSMGPPAIYPDGEFRMILTGDDGFEFVEPFWPDVGRYTNGYIYVEPSCYPRQTRNLSVRIEQRPNAAQPWKTVADFKTRIASEHRYSWRAEHLPAKRTINGVEFVLGDLCVREAAPAADSLNKYKTQLAFQVLEQGVPQLGWEAFPLRVRDAGGNSTSFGVFPTLSNGWVMLESRQVLNARQPWCLQMNFGRLTGLPASNLVTFPLRLPLEVNSPAATLVTNLLGVPVRIISAGLNGRELHFQFQPDRSDLRLDIVKIKWPDGRETAGNGSRWNERHVAWDFISAVAGTFTITLAIHPNYPVEFTVQPLDRFTLQPASK